MIHTKVCGVTCIEDARMCLDLGVSAIGINFVSASPRVVNEDVAREIADAIRGHALSVGVVANMTVAEMIALRDRLGLGCLQLHGDEGPEALAPLLPHAYKALRIGSTDDVARADAFGGEHILVDAKVDGALGGAGKSFDWSLVAGLAKRRKLTLAGGLHAENVADAIRVVSPYCVDVASGVEVAGHPRRKDPKRVKAFIEASRDPSRR